VLWPRPTAQWIRTVWVTVSFLYTGTTERPDASLSCVLPVFSETFHANDRVFSPTLPIAKRTSKRPEAGTVDGSACASGKYSSTKEGDERVTPTAWSAEWPRPV